MKKYLMDTHTWIWWHTQPEKLSDKVQKIITDPNGYDELLLSSISHWEFCKLVEKGRLRISCDVEEWLKIALDMEKLRIVPLSPVISFKSTTLPQPFHNDPADQIIVATAREENATLLSVDQKITDYQHVRSMWQ